MRSFLHWATTMFPFLSPHWGDNEEYECCALGRLMLAYKLYRDQRLEFAGIFRRINTGLEAFPHRRNARGFLVEFVRNFGGSITYREAQALADIVICDNDDDRVDDAWDHLYNKLCILIPDRQEDDDLQVAPSFAAYLEAFSTEPLHAAGLPSTHA